MTLNYQMMVERYPNLKEKIDSSILGCEISSLLKRKTCQVVNYLLCFGAGPSAFSLKKKEKKRKKKTKKAHGVVCI